VLSWAGKQTSPRVAIEDLEACSWADDFDEAHPENPINRDGIVLMSTARLDWHAIIHPLKSDETFRTCFQDRVHGCVVDGGYTWPCQTRENGSLDCPMEDTIHFKLQGH